MIKVYSKALDQYLNINRMFAHIKGASPGPTLIIVSGIHGNEPSGIFAMNRLVQKIEESHFKGNLFAFAGNLKALASGERYMTHDLNRVWEGYDYHQSKNEQLADEALERQELYSAIKEAIAMSDQPVYIVDLHTTSSKTMPFLTLSAHEDSLAFCEDLPLPKVKNVDAFVQGAFFTHMNSQGYIALGFEAGQHDAMSAIQQHEQFILRVLDKAGMYDNSDSTDPLADSAFYHIKERFVIDAGKPFKMKEGYTNFQPITKGEILAEYNDNMVHASQNGNIFLPLYQSQGNDGFFIIEKEVI